MPESVILPLRVVLLGCTIIYLIPRPDVLGAILLTGYLGGAVATHVRVGEGWFSTAFPVILGVLIWGGLCLRDGSCLIYEVGDGVKKKKTAPTIAPLALTSVH